MLNPASYLSGVRGGERAGRISVTEYQDIGLVHGGDRCGAELDGERAGAGERGEGCHSVAGLTVNQCSQVHVCNYSFDS